jgi:hypothetical protein
MSQPGVDDAEARANWAEAGSCWARRGVAHEASLMKRARSRYLLGLWLVLAVTGCPGGPAQKLEPCRRFGQTCEISPGKLGSCVERTNCTSGNCLICQSQH